MSPLQKNVQLVAMDNYIEQLRDGLRHEITHINFAATQGNDEEIDTLEQVAALSKRIIACHTVLRSYQAAHYLEIKSKETE